MSNVRSWSGALLILGIGMALTPATFALGPKLEAWAFPVVRGVELSHETHVGPGISFYARFRKVRACEFVALVWYEGPVRLTVDFEPRAEEAPRTRPVGEQYAGPWLVRGLQQLKGSRAYVYHRCHPLWTTITRFYTG